MKKIISLLCGFSLLVCTTMGCQRNDPIPEVTNPAVSAPPSPTEKTEPAVSEPPLPAEHPEPVFRAGTWMASNGEDGQYYFFDDNGSTGHTASYQNGCEVGFSYEQTGDKIVFHMEGSGTFLPCKLIETDDSSITLEWEAQSSETLTFVSEANAEHFHFYTNEELCNMTLQDYEANCDMNNSGLSAAAGDNGDGTVIIQIYQNLSDHNSTAAWYQIDRCTGEGENVTSGMPVDLTNGSPEIDITYFDKTSSDMPSSYHECIADNSEYHLKALLSAHVPVTDFRVVSLEYAESDDSQISFRILKELFSANSLTPDKPLVLHTVLSGTIPDIGITYTDRNSEAKLYTLSMSGLDGSLLLTEADICIP